MRINLYRLRLKLEALLDRLGLLSAAWSVWRTAKILIYPGSIKREIDRHRQFQEFSKQYGGVLRYNLYETDQQEKRALFVCFGSPAHDVFFGPIKALELAGFTPVVLINWGDRLYLDYYRLAAIQEIEFWSKYTNPSDLDAAEVAIREIHSNDELLGLEFAGARVGRYAMNTAMRQLRLASLDLQSAPDRRILVKYVASAMTAAKDAQRILSKVHPELVMIIDPVYSPEGELFDNCLANGIKVIKTEPAHKSNTLMLKRYSPAIRDEHPHTLSMETWQKIRGMVWKSAYCEQLQREIHDGYFSGDWYNVAWGSSSNEQFLGSGEIRKRFGLDPGKKNAFIFPHILWDAPFTWGTSLFNSYEDWFVQTVKAACMNDRVNWVIKIHPAHIGKALMEGFRGETAEISTLHTKIGDLPPHVFLIPADSCISTYSFFELMDYCITVRGTVGIEAARLGIPVITASSGRYDRQGFTVDPNSREEYLESLRHIQEIRRLSAAQQELAERYAYGLFVMRPFHLETVVIEDRKNHNLRDGWNNSKINIKDKKDWYSAADLKKFSDWVADSSQDFLEPLEKLIG